MPQAIKYESLKHVGWIARRLRIKSIAELAIEIGCHPSSIRWVVEKYLTKAEKMRIAYARRPHKNLSPDLARRRIRDLEKQVEALTKALKR